MSTIKSLTIENWLRLKGTHDLALQPKAYAVIARHENDKDRSNGLGKTALVQAVRFAFFGEHRFRTEDEWITKGENVGGVTVVCDDGFMVSRTRMRGKTTKLWAGLETGGRRVQADGGGSTGDEAQALIERYLGLTLRDFDASAYLDPSNAAARMVTADPSDRMKVIEAWLELAPLKAAEVFNAQRLQLVATEVEGLTQRLLTVASRLVTPSTEDLLLLIAAQEKRVVQFSAEEKEAAKLVEASRHFERVLATKREYDRVIAGAQQLKSTMKPATLDVEAAVRERDVASAAHSEALRDQKSKRVVAAGEFDGNCPVASIKCPVREEINSRRVEGAAAHVEASKRADEAYRVYTEANNRWVAASQDHQRAQTEKYCLDDLMKRIHTLAESLENGPQSALDLETSTKKQMACWQAKQEAVRLLQDAHKELEQREKDAKEEERLRAYLQDAEMRLTAFREAALILGPRGAQRAVAEPFLQAIEQGANEALAECGVDLTVAIQWEHEGKEIAKTCSACGQPFPASARVKQCTKCGAERGKNIVNRLDFNFSNRSKGLEDLWGVALQLAATAWLRAGRSASLELGVFDEPWAHLDKTHRRAITRAFVTMLGRFGIRQAFLISHSPDVAAFPGIITITGRADGTSSVEVTS